MVDMQVYTNCTDGFLSPRALVEKAARRGVRTLAITDYDNIDGCRRAGKAAREYGIELVPAVNLSCLDEIQIIGYYVDLQSPSRLMEHITYVKTVCLDYLEELLPHIGKELGHELSIDDFRLGKATPEAIARTLVERGWWDRERGSRKEAELWLRRLPVVPDEIRVQPRDAIRMIQGAGGKAVLAHPGAYADGDSVLKMLVPCGLDGVEVLFPGQDERQWKDVALRYRLEASAGSGFRGDPETSVQQPGMAGPFEENLQWIWANQASRQ